MPIIIPAPYDGGPGGPGVALGGMGQDKSVTVRMQTLDGVWETVGSDRDGRVKETPVREAERVVNVQGAGWQYHLDDDVYEHCYLKSSLSDYKDMRGVPGAELGIARANAAGQVTASGRQIYLGWPGGTALNNLAFVGVLLDLGPSSTAAAISIDWESSNNTANATFFARTWSLPTTAGGGGSDAFTFILNTGASGTTSGTFGSPQRYVQLFVFSGITGTTAVDHYVKLNGVRVFTSTTYQSSGVSVLKATQIISDALDRATILLSDDRSGIDPDGTVTFAFPEFALVGQKTPREVIDAADSVHGYRKQVAVRRRMIYEPRPSVPLVEIGAWPGSAFDDASANDGEEIYNRVLVTGTGAGGEPLVVERSAGQQPGVLLSAVTSPTPDNPSFAVNTATWTPSSPTTITRDTTDFDSTPAAGRWDRSGSDLAPGDELTQTFTGTFLAGRTYNLTVSLRAGPTELLAVGLTFGDASAGDAGYLYVTPAATFESRTIAWTPVADRTAATLTIQYGAN